ncbi:PREDICTED: integrin alpha-8-like [Habropoda laboriosa]|uniref:integrin alpha-8-like n=1 Tax=Habropoda laboriosa TaxID=597456 RepID=UPI00083E58BF|nr:PREDICTED: integrin alpha-8-like [Habropoda laboriosa]
MYEIQILINAFMMSLCIWFSGFIFVILKYSTLAYNLDVDNAKVFSVPIILNNQRGSYFGYSVALYTSGENSILLVGAPRANTSAVQGVIEPGTVYQCPVNDTCKEWIIDKTGNGWYKQYSDIYQIKDNAWIGATIALENKTNPRIVICGPRWKNNVINRNKPNWYMNGICYWSLVNNISSFEKEIENQILPLSNLGKAVHFTNEMYIYNYGMGQAGFSVHMTSDELKSNLILGSPGIFNWKGTPLLVTKPIYGQMQTIIPSIGNEGSIHSNDYFGYAVTSGYFTKGELWFASSAPRASNLYGNVIMFTFSNNSTTKLILKKFLRGEQHGEYFGAALASCNLNGGDKDELIVGAPLWSNNMDEGRIYVFIALYDEIFEKRSFEGKVPGSKFGSAITCLGDIDYDSYDDIAVGAPYEEETGAIYIFNGNSNGLLKHYSQKIIGKQFGNNIRGFGISIAEPRDINHDKYPDIAVGSFLSEQTILIKSKPVVRVTLKLFYNESNKILINSTIFLINVCAFYDGIHVPKYLRVVKSVKIDETYRRAYYGEEKNNDHKFHDTLYKLKNSCNELKIHLKENIQNIIDPIEISASIALEEDLNINDQKMKPNLFCTSCAVINQFHSKTEDLIKLPFATDCGEDDICTPDVKILLSTNLKADNRYIIGSTFATKFILDVFNYGEPAYQAKINIYIPEILSLASVPPACMENIFINNTLEVICDLGNPLRENKKLMLDLDMSKVRFDIDHVKLWTNFSTQSEENNSFYNTQVLTIYFDTDVDIAIAGKAQDDLYSYFLEDKDENLNSVQFQHIYEIQKFGVSPINEVILTISIPTIWKHSTGDIQIININHTINYMDGQQFHCTYKKFTMDANVSTNLPPENRSIYINCTNTNVKCTYIKCKLGPFLSSSSVAKLSLILDFYLFDFKLKMMEGKDIIFFLSNGNVNIVEPHNITQKIEHKPDSTSVATMFLGSPITEQIAAWIVVLSITSGILLLILLILALIKIGFFNRKKKEELRALKSETDKKLSFILETSSSTEILNQE